jgi:catechol 2,3-dioxygenase
MESNKLPENTHIGYVHLRVHSVEKELKFYDRMLGFHEVERDDKTIYLSANGKKPYHLILTENEKAPSRTPFSTGLFHLAIRVPSRPELAKMFLRLYENKYPFQGFADHGVSEALYMADPEGNGVEIYFDKSRDKWPFSNGRLEMVTDPLDINDLISELRDEKYEWKGLHPQTDIGHIHLQVSKLSAAQNFYQRSLGMDIMQDSFPGALFLSAGGYHHHVGVNVWASNGAGPPAGDTLGLIAFGLHVPDSQKKEMLLQQFEENNYTIRTQNNRILAEDTDRNAMELIFE